MKNSHILFSWIALTLSSSLIMRLPAQAEPLVSSNSFGFSQPIFEQQPLPKRLNTSDAWHTVAQNARLVHDYPNSIAAYHKAIELALPDNRAELLEERGWVRFLMGQFEAATLDFQASANLYRQQDQPQNLQNVRQMIQFVETQAQKLDPLS